MHPAEQLQATTHLLLVFIIPALLGLLTYKSGKRAQLWFGAGLVYAVYFFIVVLFPSREFSWLRIPEILLLWTYIVSLVYILTHEQGRNLSPKWFILLAAIPILTQLCFSAFDAKFAESVSLSFFVIIGDLMISIIAFFLARQGRGFGFMLITLSGMILVTAHIIRMEELVLGDGAFNSKDYTWKSNLLVVGHLIAVIFVNIGYAGVVLERSVRKETLAQEERRIAEEARTSIMAALQERDQMIMLNSQFAAISGMSIFAATIIHEVTQPIQALILGIHNALREAGDSPNIRQALASVSKQADECNAIIQSLRKIMIRGQVQDEEVDLVALTREVMPIIKSQCKQREIAFKIQILPSQLKVKANQTLYKRIIFNLITNAIEALEERTASKRELFVSLESLRGRAVLEIMDNSGKNLAIEDLTFATLAGSTKPNGMGLGLMLCGRIATNWSGKLSVRMDTSGPDHLTIFSLELPLVHGAKQYHAAQKL